MKRLYLAAILSLLASPLAAVEVLDLDATAQTPWQYCGTTQPFEPSLAWNATPDTGLIGGINHSLYVIRNWQVVAFFNDSLTQIGPCLDVDGLPSLTGLTGKSVSINVANPQPGFTGMAGHFRVQGFQPAGNEDGTPKFTTYGMLQAWIDQNLTGDYSMHWKFRCASHGVFVDCGAMTPQGLKLPPAIQAQSLSRSTHNDFACVNSDGVVFRSAVPCN